MLGLFLPQCVHLPSSEVSIAAFKGSFLIRIKIKWSTLSNVLSSTHCTVLEAFGKHMSEINELTIMSWLADSQEQHLTEKTLHNNHYIVRTFKADRICILHTV